MTASLLTLTSQASQPSQLLNFACQVSNRSVPQKHLPIKNRGCSSKNCGDVFSNWAKEYKMTVRMSIIRNDSVTSSSITQTTCKASRSINLDKNANNKKLRKKCKTSYEVSSGLLQIHDVRLRSPTRD
ncbi:hypothetical protein NPIL_440881 [Nephila pilipes]|uniref:Uncharacterized protein n=1 Tax=Nephila pilipes TaxID=299642 RepID=A0A8X6P4B7_NEPPI|nr:hypothetical protein NPIL_440881 [Nephila pilipes]